MWIRVEYIHSTVAWLFVLRGAVRVVDLGRAKARGVAVWCGRAVFNGATAFDQDLRPWDLSKVTNTGASACISLPGLHASSKPIHPIISSRTVFYNNAEKTQPWVG